MYASLKESYSVLATPKVMGSLIGSYNGYSKGPESHSYYFKGPDFHSNYSKRDLVSIVTTPEGPGFDA
jgi:hypothetical protein